MRSNRNEPISARGGGSDPPPAARRFLLRWVGDASGTLRGIALGFLLASALRALLSTLWYESLVTFRLNESAFWIVVLAAPALALVAPRGRAPALGAGLLVAALPWVRFTDLFLVVAAFATLLGGWALGQSGRVAWAGAALGLAANGAFLLLVDSLDPLLLPWGSALALGATALAAASPPEPHEPTRRTAGVAWACLVAVLVAYLASPFTVAKRVAEPGWAAAGMVLVGLVAGALARPVRARWAVAAGAVAAADLAWVQSPLGLGSVGVLAFALGATAARLPRPHPGVFALVVAPLLFGLLYFGQTMDAAEWRVAVPLLVAAAFVGLLRPAGPRRPTREATVALVALLTLPLGVAVPSPEAWEGGPIVVLDWNVHQGFGNRGALDPETFARVARAVDPDIVVLQEADTARLTSGGLDVARFLEARLGIPIVASGSGVVILSRFPRAEGSVAASPASWTATAELDVGGTTVTVQGVHFSWRPALRAEQVSAVLEAANATPGHRIVAGDVNACAVSPCFSGRPADDTHARLRTAFDDAWLAHHENEDPSGNTIPAQSPRRRLDVILSRGFEVLDAGPVTTADARLGSDHLPVVARLALR